MRDCYILPFPKFFIRYFINTSTTARASIVGSTCYRFQLRDPWQLLDQIRGLFEEHLRVLHAVVDFSNQQLLAFCFAVRQAVPQLENGKPEPGVREDGYLAE